MAKTLESKLDNSLTHLEISLAMMRQGTDTSTPVERLEWMQFRLADALDYARKIEKKNAKKVAA